MQRRILVVDDEPNIVDLVAATLGYQGFDVATAANGGEAITAANSFRPHRKEAGDPETTTVVRGESPFPNGVARPFSREPDS